MEKEMTREMERNGGPLSTADMDVHLGVMYKGLGEPVDSHGMVRRSS